MPPARFRRIALAGFVLVGACNDTRDLAPASPDTPWQFEPTKEAPAAPAPAAEARRFTVPENTEVQLPSPGDIDPNHTYSLVELIDIAQRRNPATRVAWEQARQAAISVGIARAGIVNLSGHGMLVVTVARQLGSGSSFALRCPAQAERTGEGRPGSVKLTMPPITSVAG